MECFSCRSISGDKRISPGPYIHEGNYWLVDHAYPTSLKGWLVIVLKRHVEALHELSQEEFKELADIQPNAQGVPPLSSRGEELMQPSQNMHLIFSVKYCTLVP